MPENTQEVKNLTEEEQKDNVRFKELNGKPEVDRTEDDRKEIGELKERHSSRVEKRISKMNWEKETAKEETRKAREEKEALEVRVAELEQATPKPKATIQQEFVEILDKDGKEKKWHTDESLLAQVSENKITEAEALKYQQRRNHEHAVSDAVVRIEEKQQKSNVMEQRKADAEDVLKRHPEWANTHQSHDANDPLFKLTTELYTEAYAANPRGLSIAEERAKQILGHTNTHVDRTNDLNLDAGGAPERRNKQQKEKEITLTPDQEQVAVVTYKDMVNPKTNRLYTENESKAAMIAAIKARG